MLYWFNPVEIILSELLSGATSKSTFQCPAFYHLDLEPHFLVLHIREVSRRLAETPLVTVALPTDIIEAVDLVRRASHWMFGLFLTSAPLITLSIFLTPLAIRSRWVNLPLTILTFLAAVTITVATVIATVMFVIFRNVITGAEESINIIPQLGIEMFIFMWIASAGAILGWLIIFAGCCCCASRRDVAKGRRRGRSKVWRRNGEVAPVDMKEKGDERQGLFGPRKK